jgi:predicted RNA-binding protein YlxR (DUF448 family)/ribosomal protein L30E
MNVTSEREPNAKVPVQGRTATRARSRLTQASKKPERTCAGCGQHAAAADLVRVVADPSGELAVDLARSGFGRGAHVHGATPCIEKAMKAGFARVFKGKVTADPPLPTQIVAAADRRIEGLLTGARRAGQLTVGGDAVVEALKEGRASLVIVARDAAAAAKLTEVERAVAAGKAIAFGEKQRLGSLMNRDEVAVLAVLHAGVAEAVAGTFRVSAPFRKSDLRSEEAWSSSEVR